MLPEQIAELSRRYRGRRVTLDPRQSEPAGLVGVAGQIKAINFNGLALVQFDGPDQGWHDIDLRRLQIVEAGPSAAKADA
jgi:hypothetical protein